MDKHEIVVEINQQQAEMLDRLIAEGQYGTTYGDAIRRGFLLFCEKHPELLGGAERAEGAS